MRIRTVAFVFTVLALVLMTPSGAAAQEQDEDTSSPLLRIDWQEFKKLYDAKATPLARTASLGSLDRWQLMVVTAAGN